MKTFQLGSHQIPALGFGTWLLTGDTCLNSVLTALEVGYRHIDTAAKYENHTDIAKAVKQSGLKREEIFITSKLWINSFRHDQVLTTAKKALDELQTEYLDLYLMHYPNKEVPFTETFDAFEELKSEGLIREWGVSNCTVHHLQDYLDKDYKIANNQVEFHPSFNQNDLKNFCDKNNILVTAYSPLAQGQDIVLEGIKKIAQKCERSASQVILNWLISKNIVAIPKATTRDLIEDNFKALEWQMAPVDVAEIDKMNTNNRLLNPPYAEFNY